MISETFQHRAESGWSCGDLPAMDSDATLALVFGASRDEHVAQRVAELRAAYPRAVIAGCSTGGEIFGNEVFDDSLSVAVMRFDHTALRLATASSEHPDAGQLLAEQLAGDGLRAVFVLAEGLNVNGTTLADALIAGLPDGVTITGGLAGDGDRFEKTWVLDGDQPTPNRVTAVGFYGPSVRVAYGCQGGWEHFGPERKVTRSDANVLYELDGKPALNIYRRYLGELAEGLPGTALLFPLSIRPAGAETALTRTILGIDQEKNSMTFAGDIPEGASAWLMRSHLDNIVDGAATAGETLSATPEPGAVSLAISCVGRRLILRHRTDEEIEGLLDQLPAGTRQVGFYSYGELAPWGHLPCGLHNQTMTVTVISEARAA